VEKLPALPGMFPGFLQGGPSITGRDGDPGAKSAGGQSEMVHRGPDPARSEPMNLIIHTELLVHGPDIDALDALLDDLTTCALPCLGHPQRWRQPLSPCIEAEGARN